MSDYDWDEYISIVWMLVQLDIVSNDDFQDFYSYYEANVYTRKHP